MKKYLKVHLKTHQFSSKRIVFFIFGGLVGQLQGLKILSAVKEYFVYDNTTVNNTGAGITKGNKVVW